jgi:hypothetical protein
MCETQIVKGRVQPSAVFHVSQCCRPRVPVGHKLPSSLVWNRCSRLRFDCDSPDMDANQQRLFDVDDPEMQRACRAVTKLLLGGMGKEAAGFPLRQSEKTHGHL